MVYLKDAWEKKFFLIKELEKMLEEILLDHQNFTVHQFTNSIIKNYQIVSIVKSINYLILGFKKKFLIK